LELAFNHIYLILPIRSDHLHPAHTVRWPPVLLSADGRLWSLHSIRSVTLAQSPCFPFLDCCQRGRPWFRRGLLITGCHSPAPRGPLHGPFIAVAWDPVALQRMAQGRLWPEGHPSW